MQNKISQYNSYILKLFKECKIKSIEVDGVLVDDYNKLNNVNEIKNIKINKKYIRLFDDEEFILKNYIKNSDSKMYKHSSGKYKCIDISHHFRIRFLFRYIILYKRCNEALSKRLVRELNTIFVSYINTIKGINNRKDFKKATSIFLKEKKDEFNKIILSLLSNSKILKEKSIQFRNREYRYGKHNLILVDNFLFVHDIKSNLLVTSLLYTLNMQNVKSKYFLKTLNEKADDLNYIMNIIRQIEL